MLAVFSNAYVYLLAIHKNNASIIYLPLVIKISQQIAIIQKLTYKTDINIIEHMWSVCMLIHFSISHHVPYNDITNIIIDCKPLLLFFPIAGN